MLFLLIIIIIIIYYASETECTEFYRHLKTTITIKPIFRCFIGYEHIS
jgi:hypothetical protein